MDTPDKNVSGSGTSASDDVKLNKAHKKITQLKTGVENNIYRIHNNVRIQKSGFFRNI